MKSRAVILDFNGTMFRDSEKHMRAWQKFAREKYSRELSDEEYLMNAHGKNNAAIIDYISGGRAAADELARLSEEKEAMYRALCLEDRDNLRLAEGLPAFLTRMKERGIPAVIATNAGKGNMDFYFEHLGLERWFTYGQVVYDDGTLPGKPEPAVYLKAAAMAGFPPGECAVFEDSDSGILSAARAGAGKIIAVVGEGSPPRHEALALACAQIRDFASAEEKV